MTHPTDPDSPVAVRLRLALDAGLRAGRAAFDAWVKDGGFTIELKPDGSHLTSMDLKCEELIRAAVAKAFPSDSILGEEFGASDGTSDYRWIIDPIDGTTSYARRIPAWGVLIGIEHRGESVAGVCVTPAMDEIGFATKGGGCHWMRGIGNAAIDSESVLTHARRVRISDVPLLGDAHGITTTLKSWHRAGFTESFERVRVALKRCQNGGFNCYNYMLLINGRMDLALDPVMKPWDLAALKPMVEEAGGEFTDLAGNRTAFGGSSLAGPKALHGAALSLFSG